MLLPVAQGDDNRIKDGSLVIVYENMHSSAAVHVTKTGVHENRFGTFKHADWIGRSYGQRVQGSQGWVYLLRPTAELWTLVLSHRTQILYQADISLVIANLALLPGSTVLESGTGSGSLTHSLLRAVAPTGHVHTFEFHQQRADAARRECIDHGMGAHVTVECRNIEEDGFPAALTGLADAVFLDLPRPQLAVPSATACLREGGRLCSFSPCIEQVQRTAALMDGSGFTDISTVECLLRSYTVKRHPMRHPPDEGADAQPIGALEAGGTAAEPGAKRQRTDGTDGDEADTAAAPSGAAENEAAAASSGAGRSRGSKKAPVGAWRSDSMLVAQPEMDARGHTGYLTFGRKLHSCDSAGETSWSVASFAAQCMAGGEEGEE